MVEKIENLVRRNPVAALLLSPIIGGVFVMAFPVIVIGMCVAALGQVVWRAVREAVTPRLVFNWRPQASYLRGRQDDGKAKGPDA